MSVNNAVNNAELSTEIRTFCSLLRRRILGDDDSTNKNMTRIIANCEDTRIQQDKNGKIAQLPQRRYHRFSKIFLHFSSTFIRATMFENISKNNDFSLWGNQCRYYSFPELHFFSDFIILCKNLQRHLLHTLHQSLLIYGFNESDAEAPSS